MHEDKRVSPRGPFLIGLAIGLGVALVIFIRQKGAYEAEIDRMKSDLEYTTKRVAEDHAQLADDQKKLAELDKLKTEKK
jgi:hypothetical protein